MSPLLEVLNWYANNSTQIGLGDLIGAFISGITALLVFILGVYIERRKNRNKSYKDLFVYNDYLSFQVNDLSISAIKQRNEIIKFLRIVTQDKEQDYFLKSITSFNPNNIVELINENLFKLLILKRSGNKTEQSKEYSNFVNSIVLLSNLKASIHDSFKDLNSKYQQYINNYKDNLEKVVRTMEDFGTYAEQHNIKIGDDVFLDKYHEIISQLIKDDAYKDIHKTYNNLILPMHKLCSNKSIVRGDIRANIIIKDIMQAKFHFESYIKLKTIYIQEFCKLAKSINKQTIIFRNSYDYLNKNKLLK